MRSLVLSVATAVVLLTAVAPGAFAADPSATDAPAPITDPNPTPTGPYDGEIVVDPTFVSGNELPTQAPSAPTRHAGPAGPAITPPPTDLAAGTSSTAGGLPVTILALVASALVALTVTPRRRPRRP